MLGEIMSKSALILVVTLLNVSLSSFLPAQSSTQQPDPLATSTPPNRSDLQLDSSHQSQLEDALKEHDYKHAEAILVEEAERDPNSMRSARLLTLAAGIFF